jgi:hypothetical protein
MTRDGAAVVVVVVVVEVVVAVVVVVMDVLVFLLFDTYGSIIISSPERGLAGGGEGGED